MRYCLEGWEDGQPVLAWLDGPNRWQTQAAERVIIELAPANTLALQQQPRALTAARLGVGACIWDGALVLAAYLAAQPPGTFAGKRCVELGAGVGAAGLTLAALGARVTLTDKRAMLPLLRGNIARNWLAAGSMGRPAGGAAQQAPRGCADAAALEWGAEGYLADAACIAAGMPVDLVVACDCVYPDPDGPSPDAAHFVAALAALCAPSGAQGVSGRALVTFEARSDEMRVAFLQAARARFGSVRRLPAEELPSRYCVQHVEVYELASCKQWQA